MSPLLSNVYLTEVDRMLERAQETTRRGPYTYLELAKLHVDINEEKSRHVDLAKGDSFGFLGFEFSCIRSLQGKWRAYYTPKLKQRTALLRKLKNIFRRFDSQPVGRVVQLINPIVRGWLDADSAPGPIGLITLGMKQAGKQSAGNLHALFDEAGTGNVAMVEL
jgi:RNA-directed DNA polymerase